MSKADSIATITAAQQVASKALPAVVDKGIPPRQQKRIVIVVPSGKSYPIAQDGNFFFVESITDQVGGNPANAVTFTPDFGNAFPFTSAKKRVHFDTAFSALLVTNPAGNNAVTVILWVGYGDYVDYSIDAPFPLLVRPSLFAWKSFFIRAADGGNVYAAEQIISGGGYSFPSINPLPLNAGSFRIKSATLWKGTNTVANTAFRLYMMDNAGAPAPLADKAAFQLVAGWRPNFLAVLDFPAMISSGAGSTQAFSQLSNLDIPIVFQTFPATGFSAQFLGELVAEAAYAAADSERFDLFLQLEQN